MPALTRNNIVTPEQISEHLSKFLSNKYAAQLGLIYATQQASIEKDLVMEREAHGGSSAKEFLARDPLLASKALSNTVTNLIAANTPSGGSIAGLENALTKGVQEFGEAARFSKEHDFFSDLKTDLEGWKALLFGPRAPAASDFARAPSAVDLENAYRRENEMRANPEAARGAALMALPAGVQPLPVSPAAPPSPQSVSVSGEARVDQTLHLDISGSIRLCARPSTRSPAASASLCPCLRRPGAWIRTLRHSAASGRCDGERLSRARRPASRRRAGANRGLKKWRSLLTRRPWDGLRSASSHACAASTRRRSAGASRGSKPPGP